MKVFKKLQKYFKSNSEEQIRKDWEKSSKFDDIESPKIDDFINQHWDRLRKNK